MLRQAQQWMNAWVAPLEELPLLVSFLDLFVFADPADAARHTRMVALVERMLDLHKRLAAAKSPPEQQMLRTQIDATDRQMAMPAVRTTGWSMNSMG